MLSFLRSLRNRFTYSYKVSHYEALSHPGANCLPSLNFTATSHQTSCPETRSILTPGFSYASHRLLSVLLFIFPQVHWNIFWIFFCLVPHLTIVSPVSLLLTMRGVKRLIESPLSFVNEKTRGLHHWPKGLQQVAKHGRPKIWVPVRSCERRLTQSSKLSAWNLAECSWQDNNTSHRAWVHEQPVRALPGRHTWFLTELKWTPSLLIYFFLKFV